MKETKLLRCLTDIDDELILEADATHYPRRRWGGILAAAACLALLIAIPVRLFADGQAAKGSEIAVQEDADEYCGTPLSPYLVPDEGILFHRYSGSGWEATAMNEEASQVLADLMYEGEDIDEMGELPATVPTEVLDFRNGTYVILYGLDTAIITTYENYYDVPPVFAEDMPEEEPAWTLRRRIPGLDEAVEQALAKSSGTNLGGLRPGMTKDEVTALMGEPVLVKEDTDEWFYGSYYVYFHSFTETVHNITTGGGCQLTLDSGIGLGSTEEAVLAAYPNHILGNSVDAVSYHISIGSDELMIETTDGVVTQIQLYNTGNPLLEALTVSEITIHTAASEGWLTVIAIDKAAKKICTTLTISDPEPADRPEGDPTDWMDFGSGTVVGLYDDDYAVVYRYDGVFDPDSTDNLRSCLEGVFVGLNDAFLNALRNPTETWETEAITPSDEIFEAEPDAPAEEP